ncbi:MAG: ECF transporter S component [Chloroflexota bacterium]
MINQSNHMPLGLLSPMRIIIAVTIGVLSGICLTPVLLRSIPLMRELANPSGDQFMLILLITAGTGILIIPGLLAYVILGGGGTALFTQIVVGIVMGITTSFFGDMLLSCLLIGIFTEAAIYAFTWYRNSNLRPMLFVGLLLGLFTAVGSTIGHGLMGMSIAQSLLIGAVTISVFGVLAALTQRVGLICQRLVWKQSYEN